MQGIVKTFIASVLVFHFISLVSGQWFSCVPDDDCNGADDGYRVPDPENCQNYFECIDGASSGTSVACENGGYFDYYNGECVEVSSCPQICFPPPSADMCSTLCDPTTNKAYDPRSCSSYFECDLTGDVANGDCTGTDIFFNGEDCFDVEADCCTNNDLCVPECPYPYIEVKLVPDPYSCNGYYVCLPGKYSREVCPDGQVFSAPIGQCVPLSIGSNTECIVYCTNGGAGGECYDIGDIVCEDTDLPRCNYCVQEYYSCLTPDPTLTSCATGFAFDPVFKICVPGHLCPLSVPETTSSEVITSSSEMSSLLSSTPTITNSPSATCSDVGSLSQCRETCECDGTGAWPVCPYCNQEYFSCSSSAGETPLKESCPNGYLFDPNYNVCRLPEFCENLFGLMCSDGKSLTQCRDTCECDETGAWPVCPYCNQEYFRCVSLAGGTTLIVENCPNGHLFDPNYNVCLLSDLCEDLEMVK